MPRAPIQRVAVRVMCFNESGTVVTVLARLVAAFERSAYELQAEVIDDGSTDGSVERINESFSDEPRVSVHSFGQRRGVGAVIRHAFRPTDADAVVLLCSDLQFAPEDVVPLIEALTDADLATATRSGRQDVLARRVLTALDRALGTIVVGISYPDIHWVRAVRGDFLTDCVFRTNSPAVDLELAKHVRQRGGSLTSVPLPHFKREHGRSKATGLRTLLATLGDIVKLGLWRFRR